MQGVGQIIAALKLPQIVLHIVLRLIQQPGKGIPAEGAEKLIRVLRPCHPKHLDLQPCLFQHGNGPVGRLNPGAVGVVADDHFLGKSGEQLGMVRRQRGPQAGHRAVKPGLVEGNGVHIPLCQDDPAQLGVFGQVQGEEVAALVEHRRVRGVEILGGSLPQHPSAKADDIPPQVDDGKHHPIAEAVIDAPLLVAHRQTRVQKVPLFIPLLGHGPNEAVPAVRGKPQAEAGHNPFGQPPALEIVQARLPHRAVELAVKESRGFLVQVQ